MSSESTPNESDSPRPPLIRRLSSKVHFGFLNKQSLEKVKEEAKEKRLGPAKRQRADWLDVPTYPVGDLDWMLMFRSILMLVFQTLVGTIMSAAYPDYDDGRRDKWWPINVLVANFWTVAALQYALWGEDSTKSITSLWQIPESLGNVVKIITKPRNIVLLGLMGFVMYNTVGSRWWPDFLVEWSGVTIPTATFQKLPSTVVVLCAFLFPISTALADFPTYYGFVLPRLTKHYPKKKDWWKPILRVIFWHTLQHITVPWLWSFKFIIWRFLTFFPMIFVVAFGLYRDVRLMPFAMMLQAVCSFPVMIESYRRYA